MNTRKEPLAIAYYVTGHGLGHATRACEIAKVLCTAGHSVTMVTGAPASVFSLSHRKAVLDSGSKQSDAFTVDMRGSLEEYEKVAVVHRQSMLETEINWLKATRAELVVSDIVPLACAAAAGAGVPCCCVSNFSFDLIYSEYASRVSSKFRSMVWQIAEDLAQASVLLRLPGYSPMPAFKEVLDVPLVVRHPVKSREETRQQLGIAADTKVALFMFGGLPGGQWCLTPAFLPPGWHCVACSGGRPLTDQPLPANWQLAAADAYTPDLVAASDVVIGKIGYGTTAECLACNKPLVFCRRDFFNEEPFLRKLLELHGFAVEISRRDFLAGNWAPFLLRAAAMKPLYKQPTDGAQVVAQLLQDIGYAGGYKAASGDEDSTHASFGRRVSRAGSVRLKDAVVWGYMMQRHNARGYVDVPDWYAKGQEPPELVGEYPQAGLDSSTALQQVQQVFQVVTGLSSLTRCPDTLAFLQSLSELDQPSPASGTGQLPEHQAAQDFFDWEAPVFLARAPGRLDVLGGIADYSGSLVLQLPTAEACHVACQLQEPGRQKLWSHVANRQASSATGLAPALQVVSRHADDTNRGPTFDMELSELEQDGQPISYAAARAYFQRDPAHRGGHAALLGCLQRHTCRAYEEGGRLLSWAAYVAGAVVVLMLERGVRFRHGIHLLVDSAVPEGKGVSSSAAVEVAVMKALAAAQGLQLTGRELALLCQKVENNVVGAPCGVMDQMAAALGEQGSLMAMTCQPAEVEQPVSIPSHIRLWGLDSGIRHSVGGTDYGSVRCGAFMGLRILSELKTPPGKAQEPAQQPVANAVSHPLPLGNGYLTNIRPSEFAQFHEERLPESMTGADFLQRYRKHYDTATQVTADATYAVRTPTAHPVFENFRVRSFMHMLRHPLEDTQQLLDLGELMYQSHASYSCCGLGSKGTDQLVELVRAETAAAQAAGQQPALYGAKITGGGSGGTVAVLGAATVEGEAAVQRVIDQYTQSTGHKPYEFRGSSMGAVQFGHLCIQRLPPSPASEAAAQARQ